MKIVTIVGARPQFIKAAAVSRAIEKHNKEHDSKIKEIMVHTGQHYDENMSQVFFDELEMRKPHYNLGVGSGTHGKMTGEMLAKIEEVLLREKPHTILVYGDTNSTLAGALAGVKLHIPVGHVEAGLRSFNRKMPEEINRVLTDHVSSFLFCPTETAVHNLAREGITENVLNVGDVMYDSVLYNLQLAMKKSDILKILHLEPKSYALATLHRAENTDDTAKLRSIFNAMEEISKDDLPVIMPLHPRTFKIIQTAGIQIDAIQVCAPISYLDMLLLEKNSRLIFTDSGGLQKEAYWMKCPCITLRDETEWVETIEQGWNVLSGASEKRIVELCRTSVRPTDHKPVFGSGTAADDIVRIIINEKEE